MHALTVQGTESVPLFVSLEVCVIELEQENATLSDRPSWLWCHDMENEQHGALKPFAYLFCAAQHWTCVRRPSRHTCHILMSCHAETDGLMLAISKLNSQLHVNCALKKQTKKKQWLDCSITNGRIEVWSKDCPSFVFSTGFQELGRKKINVFLMGNVSGPFAALQICNDLKQTIKKAFRERFWSRTDEDIWKVRE